jgi:PAS domain S-box-containing protein
MYVQKEIVLKSLVGISCLAGLYLTSLYSYLLLHSLAEMFSIIIACTIFIVAWNSRRFLDNMYLLFIGVAYLFVGGLDLMHTLSYKGMGVFQGYDANLPTQFWIAGRYAESLSLLIAPFILGRKLKINVVLLCYVAATSLLLGSIFYWNIFPDCFIEGEGLTPFKKISEYIISLTLFGAIAVLWKRRSEFDDDVLRLLIASIILTIGSEIAFTFYISVYGLSNLAGHFLKIISFYLIYKAVIVTGLNKPYNLLFRNVTKSKDALQEARDKLEQEVKIRTYQLEKAIDILKQNEKILQESGERLKRAQKVARLGFLDWNLKTNHMHWSEEVYSIFGVNRTETMQTVETTVALVHPDDLDFVQKNLDEAVQGIKKYNIEHRILRPDGSVVWVHSRAELVRDPDGNSETMLGTVLDITERKQTEKELLRISKAVESASDAIGMADPRGNHFYHNRAFTELFEYTAKELDSAGGPSVVYADKSVAKDVFDNIMSGKSWDGEIEMLSKSGRMFPALVRADAIKDEAQNIIGLIGIITDITESRKTSKSLLESEKDLQKLAGRLIANQEKELQRLARELHDDLTQQLAVMAIEAGNIEKQEDLPEDVLQKISHIKEQLIKTSKDVHHLSRDLHPSIIDDLGLARAVQSECNNFSSRTGIAVIFDPKDVPLTISNDISLSVYRIIQEGLSNIAKHANTKNAYIFIEGLDSRIVLTIRDTGAGFYFAQVRQKAGLGLGSMRERVRLVNGKLSITSKPGKGTTIEVRIPLTKEK